MQKQLAIRKEGYELAQPTQMVDLSAILKQHVVAHKLYTAIQGKNYVHVEGWQFAGGLMGTFPRVVAVENLSNDKELKWRADVEIVRVKTGEVLSRGFAICSNKENKKKSFDEYAVLSMAQTRAIGKAYRNVIGWVMKLAGYDATPAEEMTKMGDTSSAAPAPVPAPAKEKAPAEVIYECHGVTKSGCGEEISKEENDYSKKMYGKPLCRKHQKEAPRLKK
jgi:hypothetical protein